MRRITLKQFGLQRSGTNLVRYLLETHYRVNVLVNEGGWKHGYFTMPWSIRRNYPCIISIKDPFAWLVSFYHYSREYHLIGDTISFSSFLRSPLKLKGEVKTKRSSLAYYLRAENPVEHWNNLHYHWLHIPTERWIVRYEDLLRTPEASLDLFLKKYRNSRKFVFPEQKTRPTDDSHAPSEILTNTPFDQTAHYRERRYMREYQDIDRLWVETKLDPEIVTQCGYQPTDGRVYWFTGLPAAGKTTLAKALAQRLNADGRRVKCLDGDEIRALFPGTGFSKEDRDLHAQRVGTMANQFRDEGYTVIVSLISPYRETREKVRKSCANFYEIFVNTPLEECIRRDPKGLYQRALRGEISDFTGISAPYEPPLRAELTVDTRLESVESTIDRILLSP